MREREFIHRLAHDKIVAAISAAEKTTSGQIRVFISRRIPIDAVAAAQKEFTRLGMDKTRDRNGVLIYVAPRVHKFAVIGDEGVHTRCGEGFWTEVAGEMSGFFKKEQFTQGIVHGIARAGELLSRHFPRGAGDVNQLPDEVEHD
jgi:uncharacterized membrane protein